MKELEECSVSQIYCVGNGEPAKFRIPIYQRNYAWERDEICTFIQDVSDSMLAHPKSNYYIGTLVTYKRDDNIFEVVDGQQRLTTIYLILKALEINEVKNVLTYSARKAASSTLAHLSDSNEEGDQAIKQGYAIVRQAIDNVNDKDGFKNYFLNNVHLIHYQVPKDVDLNHYFEVMNSRGEQLEKHEIVKARLLGKLKDDKDSMARFSRIWEVCTSMNCYAQQKLGGEKDVLSNEGSFVLKSFEDFPVSDIGGEKEKKSISDLLDSDESHNNGQKDSDSNDKFQPVIDFPNLLLIALKITKIRENGSNFGVALDDKELLSEFDKANLSTEDVKNFAYNLLKAKFYLDNYIVHRLIGEDREQGNPWRLQRSKNDGELVDLTEDDNKQRELVHLLSMFEVTFSAKQRKNYLLYCLLHLFENDNTDNYLSFLRKLADKYFCDVYLNEEKLAENKQPKPNSFDEVVLPDGRLNVDLNDKECVFDKIYEMGFAKIPLFVFNYTDYKLWRKYADDVRGEKSNEKEFFDDLGCVNFGLSTFNDFYFSTTRKSLEHFFPQANVGEEGTTVENINCFGNFAMIGSDANSAGSNWKPAHKVNIYSSAKTNKVSVASLKFRIMLQICQDRGQWNPDDMQTHQTKILKIIMPHSSIS